MVTTELKSSHILIIYKPFIIHIYIVTSAGSSYNHVTKPVSKADRSTKPASRAATKEPASDQEEFVGELSEEDDSLDQEAAMLSPLKGSELQVEAAKISYRGIFYR
jgi:hypothetical protein